MLYTIKRKSDPTPFEVYYFEDERGEAPVRDYILGLPIRERAKVFAYLTLLSEVGPHLRRPHADYLGERTGLYELRPGRDRILYFFFRRNRIILLHAFLKKSQEIPKRDIETALERKRMTEIFERYESLRFEAEEGR